MTEETTNAGGSPVERGVRRNQSDELAHAGSNRPLHETVPDHLSHAQLISYSQELLDRVTALENESHRYAGQVGHMTRLMNLRGIQPVRPIHRRVELLCLALDQSRLDLKLAQVKGLCRDIAFEAGEDDDDLSDEQVAAGW